MAKYFIDFEFIEGTQTKRILGIPFSKTLATIDIISIGIVSEDNRQYYAISKDFNLKEAWNRYQIEEGYNSGDIRNIIGDKWQKKVYWIRENVLKPIYLDLLKIGNIYGDQRNHWEFTYSNLKRLIKWYGKTNKQIAEELKDFVYGIKSIDNFPTKNKAIEKMDIQLYGYYSSFDHIALAWLFGKMIDLPKGFPMYTRDLKQMLDELEIYLKKINRYGNGDILNREGAKGVFHEDYFTKIENHPNYPKETNSHNALSDAIWNKQLYEFINSI